MFDRPISGKNQSIESTEMTGFWGTWFGNRKASCSIYFWASVARKKLRFRERKRSRKGEILCPRGFRAHIVTNNAGIINRSKLRSELQATIYSTCDRKKSLKKLELFLLHWLKKWFKHHWWIKGLCLSASAASVHLVWTSHVPFKKNVMIININLAFYIRFFIFVYFLRMQTFIHGKPYLIN